MKTSDTKDRPILFNSPMVRALLDGSKTQTRRIWKLPKGHRWDEIQGGMASGNIECDRWPGFWHVAEFTSPYGREGDQLWVREAWHDNSGAYEVRKSQPIYYRADYPQGAYDTVLRWKPSIHMPRWASRITLEITSVRVERLQDISEADASAEGLMYDSNRIGHWSGTGEHWFMNARDAYRNLWEAINGPGSWAANPWVWFIQFKLIKP